LCRSASTASTECRVSCTNRRVGLHQILRVEVVFPILYLDHKIDSQEYAVQLGAYL
jgi:hypothetical protein